MDSRSRSLLQSLLIGYLVLLIAAILTSNPLVSRAADLGFAVVSVVFGYIVYTTRASSDDERVVLATAAAFVLAGIAQLVGFVPGFTLVQVAATVLFLLGFVGYFYLRRR